MNPNADAISRLRARHPDIAGPLGASWWQLVRDAYQASGGFRVAVERARTDAKATGDTVQPVVSPVDGSYLRRFGRETAQAFGERQRVSFYRNHVRTIVSQYQGLLWRRPPQREATIAAVASWWADTDGAGTPVARWLPLGSRRAQLFGWAAAYFDRPREAQSLASARTFARWLQPEELADWQHAPDGSLEWVRLCTVTCARDPFTGAEVRREHYTTWTREVFQVDVVEGAQGAETLTSTGPVPHALGAVPVAILYWQPPEEPSTLFGTSHIDGAVSASLELFNVSSEARAVERGSAFPILYLQTRTRGTLASLKLGVNNGIEVENDVTMPPGFITPPAEISAHYAARRAELRDEVYQSANLDPPAAQIAPPESGVARAYKFLPRRSVLVDACEQLAVFERRCVEILARWEGATTPEAIAAWQAATTVTYATDFDVQDAGAALEQGKAVLDLDTAVAPVTRRAARLSVGRAVAPQATPADDAALNEQVETLYQRDLATLNAPKPAAPPPGPTPSPDPAASGARDPALPPGANGGGNGPAAGA